MSNIRPLDFSNHDIKTFVQLSNLCWPDHQTTEASVRHDIETWPPKYFITRNMIEHDGAVIGLAEALEMPWSYKPGKYFISINIHPDYRRKGHAKSAYQFLLDELNKRDPAPAHLVGEVREDMTPGVTMLESLGYTVAMRYPISHLTVAEFDPAPFASSAQRFKDSGLKARTLADLKTEDPDWSNKLYDLVWAIAQDVPSTDPPEKPTKEEFDQRIDSPSRLYDGYFIAVDGDSYVGLSNLSADLADKKKVFTGLTGVIRSHRRKSVATALKLHAIEFARQYGAEIIETDNEENNPMYQINVKLGFKPVPGWVEYHKAVSSTP